MNAVEAKEIIKHGVMPGEIDNFDLAMAESYLDCLRGEEVKELVGVLKYANKELTRHKFYEGQGRLLTAIKKSLSKFREAQK